MKQLFTQLSETDSISVPAFIKAAEDHMSQVFFCEWCTIYFVDETNRRVWTPPRDGRAHGLWMEFGEGLAGALAEGALAGNEECTHVALFNDLDPDTMISVRDLDEGFQVRNALLAPIWGGTQKD